MAGPRHLPQDHVPARNDPLDDLVTDLPPRVLAPVVPKPPPMTEWLRVPASGVRYHDGHWERWLSAVGGDGVSTPVTARAAACGLDPGDESPKAARDFTRSTLESWRLCALYDDSAVVVSELVTNALRYALRPGEPAWPFRLVLVRHDLHLVCMVTDPSEAPPVPQEPDYAAETGRGLHIIDAVSRAWGWTPLCYGRGKAVWAAFSLPGPA